MSKSKLPENLGKTKDKIHFTNEGITNVSWTHSMINNPLSLKI